MMSWLDRVFGQRARLPSRDEIEMMNTRDLHALLEWVTEPTVRELARKEIAFREKFSADTSIRICVPRRESESSEAV